MKTVKDVSEITGISIRTLRYYDEIGLLKPTELTEAGYRLYDNKALEKLQEIMFFRELEIPLIDIKKIMDNPNYDKERALLAQKSLLEQKRNRLNGIIELITDVMKGVNTMSFGAFGNEEVQKMVNHILSCMSKESLDEQVQKYGSMEKYKEYLISGFANERATADLLKWYGSKEKALDASKNPGNTEIFPAYQKQLEEIVKKLAGKKGQDVNSFEVKELVEEYDFVTKQMFQLSDATSMELEIAAIYRTNKEIQAVQDSIYGEGTTEFIGQVIEAFYSKK